VPYDALFIVCDMEEEQVIEKKATCIELLVAANEMIDGLHGLDNALDCNPLRLAMDIHHGRRSIFSRHEVTVPPTSHVVSHLAHSSSHAAAAAASANTASAAATTPRNSTADPYQLIRVSRELQRRPLISEMAGNYTAMYRKSPSNYQLRLKDTSLLQVEDCLRNYLRDGYRISPGIKAYLTSSLSERRHQPLPPIQMAEELIEQEKTNGAVIYPICWDTRSVPAVIKAFVYKIADGRNSVEAKQRARNLVHIRRQNATQRKQTKELAKQQSQHRQNQGTTTAGAATTTTTRRLASLSRAETSSRSGSAAKGSRKTPSKRNDEEDFQEESDEDEDEDEEEEEEGYDEEEEENEEEEIQNDNAQEHEVVQAEEQEEESEELVSEFDENDEDALIEQTFKPVIKSNRRGKKGNTKSKQSTPSISKSKSKSKSNKR
jgi:hypothetical protein